MQSLEVGEKILGNTPYGVRVEGVKVLLTIGTKNVEMDHVTALRLSAFLRNGGREAKANAGDSRQLMTVYANLTDANLDELNSQRMRDGTIAFRPKSKERWF